MIESPGANPSGENPRGSASFNVPARVIVSLRAGVVLALANIICVCIFACAWTKARTEPKSISVTGSARKAIRADLITWSAKVSASDPELTRAYDALNESTQKTLAYLKIHGVLDSAISVSSVGTWKRRSRDEKGNETEKIAAYELWQNVDVSSNDVDRIGDVARQVTALIKDGVVIESSPPAYIYTKLSDLKVSMLADATRDATSRAQQIASNSGARLGSILDAHMGVMQINPVHSYETSGSGVNDTTSLDKEITAVVSTHFALQ